MTGPGRLADGAAAARRALAVAREAGAPGAEAAALLGLCQASWFSDGDAVGWARQACRIDPATIPGDYARDCRTFLTVALTEAGDLDEARETAGSLLTLSRQAGDLSSEAVGLFLLADVEVRAGRVTDAWERLQAAVRAALDIQHRLQLMVCLPIGAELCAAAARWPDVVTLYAARREELTGRAVSELTPGELRRAEERGAQMTLETAADFLLIAQPPDPRDTPARGSHPPGTGRGSGVTPAPPPGLLAGFSRPCRWLASTTSPVEIAGGFGVGPGASACQTPAGRHHPQPIRARAITSRHPALRSG